MVDKWDYKNEKTMCIGHVFVNHASALRFFSFMTFSSFLFRVHY